MTTPKIEWINSWRGVMILVIVFFHSLGAAMNLGDVDSGALVKIYDFITRFHMVSFFAISGIVFSGGALLHTLRKPFFD